MKNRNIFIILVLLLAAAFTAGISLGTEFINPLVFLKSLVSGDDSLKSEIILRLRLPRTLCAVFTGASLAVCGAVFQSLFRNPLADPFVTGVSGGAALGYSIAVILAISPGMATLAAFAGSLASIMLMYFFSRTPAFGGSGFILAGVALSFILSSSVMLIFSVAESESVHKTVMWMMGDLNSAGDLLPVLSAAAAALMLILWMFHRHLNVIAFGSSFSISSGLTEFETRLVLLLASFLAALSVVMGGIVPFVGLMVPHFVRRFSGADNFVLIPASALSGGIFLAVCDALSRTLIVPYEIPVGVITGFTGGIFFLYFVMRRRAEY